MGLLLLPNPDIKIISSVGAVLLMLGYISLGITTLQARIEGDDESACQDFSDDWQQRFDWVWHLALFCPQTWNGYAYINRNATELVAAIPVIAGFAVPALRQRYSVIATGLIIGVLWGVWHIVPMVIMPSVAYAAPFSPAVYIAVRTLSFLVGSLVAFRVLMVWVYERTHSLLLLILMHTGLTAANIIYEPEALGGSSNFILDFMTAAVFWLIVARVIRVNRGQLARSGQPPANSGAPQL